MFSLLRSTVSAANYGAGAAVRAKLQSYILKKKGMEVTIRVWGVGELCVAVMWLNRNTSGGRWWLSWLAIKAQPLTSQHMLNDLLKAELTPRGGIKRRSSCICECYVSAVGAANSLLVLSWNQEACRSKSMKKTEAGAETILQHWLYFLGTELSRGGITPQYCLRWL